MIEILCWFAFLVAALGYGLALLELLRLRLTCLHETLVWCITIGLGVMAFLALEIAFLQVVYSWVTWTLIATGIMLAALFRKRLPCALPPPGNCKSMSGCLSSLQPSCLR